MLTGRHAWSCRCIVNDQVVSEAELKFSLLSR